MSKGVKSEHSEKLANYTPETYMKVVSTLRECISNVLKMDTDGRYCKKILN